MPALEVIVGYVILGAAVGGVAYGAYQKGRNQELTEYRKKLEAKFASINTTMSQGLQRLHLAERAIAEAKTAKDLEAASVQIAQSMELAKADLHRVQGAAEMLS